MNTLTLTRDVDFVISVLINGIVLLSSALAYRRTKMMPFVFWVSACLIAIILAFAQRFFDARFRDADDYRIFFEFYSIGYVAVTILWGAGILTLTRYVLARFQKMPPNTALEPTPTAP
jgi:hypothetical protein